MDGNVYSASGTESIPNDYEYSFWSFRDIPLWLYACFITVCVLGLAGNTLVIVVLARTRLFHPSYAVANCFILHQSVVDLLGTVVFIFNNVVPRFPVAPNSLSATLFCKLFWSEYFLWTPVLVSSLNLTALSVERYLGIVHPFLHRGKFSIRLAYKIFALEWVFSCCYTSSWFVLSRNADDHCELAGGEVTSRSVLFVDTFLQVMAPLGIMTYAYVQMFQCLANRTAVAPSDSVRTISSNMVAAQNNLSAKRLKASRSVFKMLCIVFFSFIVCWAPMTIYNLMYVFGRPMTFEDTFYMVSTTLCMCNVCVNPIIYSLKYKGFRDGVGKMISSQHRSGVVSITAGSSVRNGSTRA